MPSLFLGTPSLPSCALMHEWERSTGLDALSYLGVPDLDLCEIALLNELLAAAKAKDEDRYEPTPADYAALDQIDIDAELEERYGGFREMLGEG